MRILHVIPTYFPAVRYGGPIFAVHSLCRALVARGHEVEVYTTNLDGLDTTVGNSRTAANLDGVMVRYFPSNILRRLSWAPSMARSLRHRVDKFDVVHIHTVFLWPTLAAARASYKADVPYLISPRGMLIKKLIAKRNPIIKNAWLQLIERRNLQHATAIHVTSNVEANELSHFGWPLPNVLKISNGVDDPAAFGNTDVGSELKKVLAGPPYVLFLGRLSWKKRLDALLQAFALSNHPKLVIAGTDDEGLAMRLAQVAEELKISDRVSLVPRTILGAEKERLFAGAQAFVLPSYSENFGNAVLEAMRRSVPVVVTPEVGAAELVRESQSGVVTEGDPRSLAEAIDRLAANPTLAREMGIKGARFATKYYGWPVVAEQMERLYEMMRGTAVLRGKESVAHEPSWSR